MKHLSISEVSETIDTDAYHDLARDRMNGIDMVTGVEMAVLLRHRLARLWEARREDGTTVGYCSVLIQSPDHPERSVHFLNMFVLDGFGGQGYGTEMVGFRVKRFGHLPLVVAIRPDNVGMQRIVSRFGFRPGRMRDAWRVWHRAPDQRSILVEGTSSQSDLVESVSFALRDVGFAPTVRLDQRSARDAVVNSPWPDPAAFSSVVHVANSVGATAGDT